MMLFPSMSELKKVADSRYSLVIAVSKRARQIAQDALEAGIPLKEKPVKLAIDELASGKAYIAEQQ